MTDEPEPTSITNRTGGAGLNAQGDIGKTELALKLAALLTYRYPDTQIIFDLKSVSDSPLNLAQPGIQCRAVLFDKEPIP